MSSRTKVLAPAVRLIFTNRLAINIYVGVPNQQRNNKLLRYHFTIKAMFTLAKVSAGNTKGGKYHCTIDLLFDWFGLVYFANKNKNCQLSYS
jgi:hypothetical protein